MDLPAPVIFVLTFVWVAVTGGGAVLLLIALRGRKIDYLPRCRRCRYVITGGMIDPTTCPECGTDLREPGSLRIGRRRGAETPGVFGCIFLAAGIFACIAVTTRSAANRDLRHGRSAQRDCAVGNCVQFQCCYSDVAAIHRRQLRMLHSLHQHDQLDNAGNCAAHARPA